MRIAICDDEPACCNTIVQLIEPYITEKIDIKYDLFYSGEEILKLCGNHPIFDIVFLDIEMQGLSGLETAKRLLELHEETIIIFTTSHVNYVSDTFRLKTFQFLVKPIAPEVFRLDFERAMNQYMINHTKYVIKWRNEQTYLEYKEILYIDIYMKHLYIHTAEQRYECVGKISEEEEKLRKFCFIRCHQSYLVNIKHIKAIGKNNIVLSNNEHIFMSRKMRSKVFEAFNLYLAGYSI